MSIFIKGDVVWILENKDQYDSGADEFGLYEYTLKNKNAEGLWSANPTGFFADGDGCVPLIEKDIDEQRIVRLSEVKTDSWNVHLGEIVLGWKVFFTYTTFAVYLTTFFFSCSLSFSILYGHHQVVFFFWRSCVSQIFQKNEWKHE